MTRHAIDDLGISLSDNNGPTKRARVARTNFTLLTCSSLSSQFGLHLQLLDTWDQPTALPPPIKGMFDLRVFDRRSLTVLSGPPVPPSMTLWLLQELDGTLLLVPNVLVSQRVLLVQPGMLYGAPILPS